MVSFTASTRQPPAGGPKATVRDHLLWELRRGERDAFARFFRLFRGPVYDFSWRLLLDERLAADATSEALVGVFRRVMLDDHADDLEVVTFACALEACEDRAAAGERGEAAGHGQGAGGAADAAGEMAPRSRRRGRVAASAVGGRFAAALASLEPSQRAALLLHDLQRMDVVRIAAVLGTGEGAAGAALFRAREEFRRALQAHDSAVGDGSCRQAEDALAGTVGLGLSGDELTRLRRHGAYCRSCRAVMKEWARGAFGLAVALPEPRLPEGLDVTPVFGDPAEVLTGSAAVRRGRAVRALARTGRALRGRAAAWSVATACLALAAGVVVHGVGVRPLVLMQSVGPAIELIVAPPARSAGPGVSIEAAGSGTAPTGSLASGRGAAAQAPVMESSLPTATPQPSGSAGPGAMEAPAGREGEEARAPLQTFSGALQPIAAAEEPDVGAAKASAKAAKASAKVAKKDAKAAETKAKTAAKTAKGTKTSKKPVKAAAKAARASGQAAAAGAGATGAGARAAAVGKKKGGGSPAAAKAAKKAVRAGRVARTKAVAEKTKTARSAAKKKDRATKKDR